MRIEELLKNQNSELFDALNDFLPLASKILEINSLPKIKLVSKVDDDEQPTFGKFINSKNIIHLAIKDRHILDILRTLAHELAHYKQNVENRLNPHSGETGSPEENEAHTYAGVIMRTFNKKYPHYFDVSPVDLEEDWKKKLGTAALIGAGLLGAHHELSKQNLEKSPQFSVTRSPEELAKLPTAYQNDVKNHLIFHGVKGIELAQFLAQVAHETGNFASLEELPDASGKEYFYKKYWYNKNVRKLLGNKTKEDAYNFRGRGWFHLTGRYNYTACAAATGLDLVNNPDLAANPNPEYQIPIALWYWKQRVLRRLGTDADFSNTTEVTRFINANAGPKNIGRRHGLFEKYLELLGLSEPKQEPEKETP